MAVVSSVVLFVSIPMHFYNHVVFAVIVAQLVD